MAVDWGDESDFSFWGNLKSCKIRFPALQSSEVQPLDTFTKQFDTEHVYIQRNIYRMHVFGFDERNYAEAFLDLTIFRMPCTSPRVWLPKNQTSFLKWDAVPMIHRSKQFQIAAKAHIECNGTIPTYMSWRVFTVVVTDDPDSQIGKKETLTQIQINETISSWNSALLDVPKLTFMYGLHKFVFRFSIETGNPEIPMYKEAYTYVNITKSPLMPVLIEGSAAKVSRGWSQSLTLFPSKLSTDPDFPEEKQFNYTWWCRVILPEEEEFKVLDDEGFPIFKEEDAQRIRKPGDAILINPPPGCFGAGPGPLKTKAGTLGLNTASLITYSRIYEIMLILSKDTRQAKAKIELDLGSVPAPISAIRCSHKDLCFPAFGGVFVNPTSRLAVKGACEAECDGKEKYHWSIYQEKLKGDELTTVSTELNLASN